MTVLLVTVTAASGSVAVASTVAVEDPFVRYIAATGERNQVTVTPVDGQTNQIVDGGAVIVAGTGCQPVSDHAVRCSSQGLGALNRIVVDAGDMDDTVALSVSPAVARALVEDVELDADGGSGNDVLRVTDALDDSRGAYGDLKGGSGDDRLWGGTNSDGLDGGGGRDELYGGAGSDWLTDGDRDGAADDSSPGPDILNGGSPEEADWRCCAPAGDRVSYGERTNPVAVDLREQTPNGEQGEGDTITGVEDADGGNGDDTLHGGDTAGELRGGRGDDAITGGVADDEIAGEAGNDRLTGNAGNDWIDGGRGNDRVLGDPGRDEVTGGRGNDRVLGGPGHDTVSGGTGDDTLKCGPGTDDVIDPRRDLVLASCERIAFHKSAEDEYFADVGLLVAAHPSTSRWPSLVLRVACPWYQIAGVTNPRRRISPQGAMRIRTEHGRRPVLARAKISDQPPTCATAPSRGGVLARAPVTQLGQRLTNRKDGVLVTLFLSVRVVLPASVEGPDVANFRATWMIRLTAPRNSTQ